MEQRTSLTEIIEYIDPGSLSYQDWVNVGMALKLEGYPVSGWDQWSQNGTMPENVRRSGEVFLVPPLR